MVVPTMLSRIVDEIGEASAALHSLRQWPTRVEPSRE
jgi:hypothetical protein